jgi:transposase
MVRTGERAWRLTSIPSIGVLNATALMAAVGNAATFTKGRNLAAWLGLVPRQATTGDKPKLLGITKRGSRYLRKMLIQGARSAMPTLAKANTAVSAWLRALLARPSQRRRCHRRRENGPHCLGASTTRAELRTRAAGGGLTNTRPS